MKKIISALTLGAMIAGAAFADVSVNLNYRQRAVLYSAGSEYKAKNLSATKDALYVDDYCGNGSDNLSISLSGDIVSFDMQWVADQNATAAVRAKGLNASVFLGPVTVFGGIWADGKQNGAYRNKVLIDAANLEGADFETWKIGSGYANAPDNWVDNMVGMPGVNLPEYYAAGITYKVPGIDNGALSLNAVYVTNERSDTSNSTAASDKVANENLHSFNFLADGRIDGVGQAELSFKYGDYWIKNKPTVPTIAAGLYVMPTTIRNLFTTVGGSIGMIDGNFEDYSIQLRLHYVAKPNKLTFTSFHSFQALTDAEQGGKDYGLSNKASRGIANLVAWAENNKEGLGSNHDVGDGKTHILARDQILTNNLAVRYFVTPNVALTGIVADMIGLGENMGKKLTNKDGKECTDAMVDLRASAWAQFYADKNNSLSIGFVYTLADVTDTYNENVSSIAVPVIFRVKM